MKNEVDDFLEQVSGEKTQNDPFTPDVTDPLAVPTTKSDEVVDDKGDDDDKSDKPLPFHKDPKIQRFIEKEISKRVGAPKPPVTEQPRVNTEDELTDTLIEIIGNDTPQKVAAVKKFREQLGRLEERGADRAISQLQQQAEAEKAAEAESYNQLLEAFDEIEEDFDVDLTSNTTLARKERNDFVEFIKRVSPKDQDGNVTQYPDIKETYKLFQGTRKPVENKRAKDISSRSMSRSSDANTAPTQGRTWKDIDKIFNKL